MSDRELLEFAAKAAGIAVPKQSPWGGFDDRLGLYELPSDGSHVTSKWNPLEDDGDALRLAVKLQISLIQHPSGMDVTAVFPPKFKCEPIIERQTLCPFAGMRRAIVLAAAEIGRRL